MPGAFRRRGTERGSEEVEAEVSSTLRQSLIDDGVIMRRGSLLSGGLEIVSGTGQIARPAVQLAERGIKQVIVAQGRFLFRFVQGRIPALGPSISAMTMARLSK